MMSVLGRRNGWACFQLQRSDEIAHTNLILDPGARELDLCIGEGRSIRGGPEPFLKKFSPNRDRGQVPQTEESVRDGAVRLGLRLGLGLGLRLRLGSGHVVSRLPAVAKVLIHLPIPVE